MSKIQLNSRNLVMGILPFLLVFFASVYRPTDPDLGWHLKYGEYFFENLRPLYANTFSTQMSDFRWANVSWGTDIITFALYKTGGFLGLTIGGAAIVTLIFLFFSKAYELDYWEKAIIFPLLLYFIRPINSNSFRGQLISLALFGLLTYIISRYEKSQGKILYVIPLLFLLWVNIHGLFSLGFAIFILWQGFYLVSVLLQEKRLGALIAHLKILIPVTFLSFIATALNPFGLKIHSEVLSYANNPLLQSISEYLPVENLSLPWLNLFLTAILAGIGIIAFSFGGQFKKKLPQIGIFTVLFLLSMWIKRYAWAMYFTLIPLVKPIASFVKPEKEKSRFIAGTTLFLISLVFVIFLKIPLTQFTQMNWNTYCEIGNGCSPASATALADYYSEGKTMTLYNWGGWLIWNFPDLKPSVDGRMHLWRDKTGYSAFEYDYNIEQNVTDINSSDYNVVYTSITKNIYEQLQVLVAEQLWEQVYGDETAAIFIRKSNAF